MTDAYEPLSVRIQAARAWGAGLRGAVSRFWSISTTEAAEVRTLPDGCVDLFYDRDEGRTFVTGVRTEARAFVAARAVFRVGARLVPGAAHALLREPLSALTGGRVALAEILGAPARALDARLADAASADDAVVALAAFLRDSPRRDVDPRVARAVVAIAETNGAADLGVVARAAGASARTLDRLFDAWIGLGPKRFARVVRFQAVLRRVTAGGPAPWARIAAELGFSDQAHLVHEFARFAGAPPARFFTPPPRPALRRA